MKKFVITLCTILIVVLSIKPFLYWQNETVGITNYTITSAKIPKAFDNYKIVVLADIHGEPLIFDKNTINKIENMNADMLVFGGDMVDEGISNSDINMEFFLKNCKLPKKVFAVSGNHDLWAGGFEQLTKDWEKHFGVTFLENKKMTITKDNESINLFGISDPNIWDNKKATRIVENSISSLNVNEDSYNILLFHRANMLDLFNDEKFDLVLSGHMHGGQVGIPFVGGLKSPHGDWFPKYSGGKYTINDNTYIVSRGIGNAVTVPRIFNCPEIVVITLKKSL